MGFKTKKEQLLKICGPKGRIEDTPLVKTLKIKIRGSSKEVQKHQKNPIGKQLMDVNTNRSSGGC